MYTAFISWNRKLWVAIRQRRMIEYEIVVSSSHRIECLDKVSRKVAVSFNLSCIYSSLLFFLPIVITEMATRIMKNGQREQHIRQHLRFVVVGFCFLFLICIYFANISRIFPSHSHWNELMADVWRELGTEKKDKVTVTLLCSTVFNISFSFSQTSFHFTVQQAQKKTACKIQKNF